MARIPLRSLGSEPPLRGSARRRPWTPPGKRLTSPAHTRDGSARERRVGRAPIPALRVRTRCLPRSGPARYAGKLRSNPSPLLRAGLRSVRPSRPPVFARGVLGPARYAGKLRAKSLLPVLPPCTCRESALTGVPCWAREAPSGDDGQRRRCESECSGFARRAYRAACRSTAFSARGSRCRAALRRSRKSRSVWGGSILPIELRR